LGRPNTASPGALAGPSGELLKSTGFSWRGDGRLMDRQGQPVEFSIIASSSNAQRSKMATIIQDDLSQLGMDVHVVPLESGRSLTVFFRPTITRQHHGLGGGDADPNPEMNVWLSNGGTHLGIWENQAGNRVGSANRPAHAKTDGAAQI